MIPAFQNPQKQDKSVKGLVMALLGVSLILAALSFVAIGIFKLTYALFTDYTATALDLLYFLTGSTLLFLITILNFVVEIKNENKTIAKGIVHLLRNRLGSSPGNQGNFNDTLKNLFNFPPGASGSEMTGSISVVDLNNPDKPLFTGDFKNMDEMNNLKKDLLDKMLNSKKDFKGKKMTKQEMLDTMNLRELKSELKTAVDSEDWLWAASLRDRISEKEGKKRDDDSEAPEKKEE